MDENYLFLETTQVPNLDDLSEDKSSKVDIIALDEDICDTDITDDIPLVTLDEDIHDTDDTDDIPLILLYDNEEDYNLPCDMWHANTNYDMSQNIIKVIDLD